MELNIIVAHDKNNIIGSSKTNDLLWHLPEDLKKFRIVTSNYPMIMGKNTYLSLPKVLPGRKHIVITNSSNLDIPIDIWEGPESENQVIGFTSLTKAIIYCQNWIKAEKSFIIGGGKLYKAALKDHKINKIYRTFLDAEFDGDIKFPEVNLSLWNISSKETFNNENFNYSFEILESN